MAQINELMIHGVLTPVIELGVSADTVEDPIRAEIAADAAEASALLSESWAVGGAGVRDGEDTDNSKYWAERSQAYAEQATVPAVAGVYNIILQDRVTGGRYALIVENGTLVLLGVSAALDATEPVRIDTVTGTAYYIAVEDGVLVLDPVEEG